jgi:SAM-dependent methyltransferase
LRDAGAAVVAVEPDPRMAQLAAAKGIDVEQATFETWHAAGRTFDLVVFAASFHWVQPDFALQKIATILRPNGRLALLGIRIVPLRPSQQALNEIYRDYVDVRDTSSAKEQDAMALLEKYGYRAERRRVTESLHYSTDGYIGLALTYSTRAVLEPEPKAQLRAQLAYRIGSGGVAAEAVATAIVCHR